MSKAPAVDKIPVTNAKEAAEQESIDALFHSDVPLKPMGTRTLKDLASLPFIQVRQELPLPTDHAGILQTLEGVLKQGYIQRIVLQVGKPIIVDRLTKEHIEGSEPAELVGEGDEVLKRVLDAEVVDLPLPEDEISTFEKLFLAFDAPSIKLLRPSTLLVNSPAVLRETLGLEETYPVGRIFGVAVEFNKEVPPRSLILVGTDETGAVVSSIRVAL